MANHPSEPPTDDFLEQILGLPTFASADPADASPMMLQLNSGDAAFHAPPYQLGLSLDQGKGGFLSPEDASGSGNRFRDDVVDTRPKNVTQSIFSISVSSAVKLS